MRIEQIYRYQLKDMFENKFPYDVVSLTDLLTEYGINYTIAENSHIQDLFQMVFNRFYNYVLFEIKPNENSQLNIEKLFAMWIRRFLNQYECTKMFYETLLDSYEGSKAKLMADVEASTDNEVIFNDTPQTAGGIFKTTDYATNYTKTTSKTKAPMKTPIERLKDLQDNLQNLWKDWSNQFHKLFLETQEGAYYE